MTPEKLPLCTLLVTPARAADMSLRDWETVIVQARKSKLLGLLHHVLSISGHAHHVPERVWNHLASAAQLVAEQHLSLGHEIRQILDALKSVDGRIVVLKGGAYVLRGLAAGHGRTFSDIDILVPREKLGEVEARLMVDGWVSQHRDAYDQRYYRQWMHELPPMRHIKRGSVLDVHHAILPPTARLKPDSALLLVDAVAAGDDERIRVLARPDMVLHSAAHLFADGELDGGLRNLWDIHCLLDEFADDNFWSELQSRAAHHGLWLPTRRAVRLAHRLYGTEVPTDWRKTHWQDGFYIRRLTARDAWGRGTRPFLRLLFYIRSHWLRMPPLMLVRHLWTKWRKR